MAGTTLLTTDGEHKANVALLVGGHDREADAESGAREGGLGEDAADHGGTDGAACSQRRSHRVHDPADEPVRMGPIRGGHPVIAALVVGHEVAPLDAQATGVEDGPVVRVVCATAAVLWDGGGAGSKVRGGHGQEG